MDLQGSFCVCTQPMSDDVTMSHCLSLAGRIHILIPGFVWFIYPYSSELHYFHRGNHMLDSESFYNANFVITGGIAGCQNDNLHCGQWWQSWHSENCQFSVYDVIYDDIWGLASQKQASRVGISNYIPQYLWDVISCPCHLYLLPAHKSSIEVYIILVLTHICHCLFSKDILQNRVP